MRRAYSPHLSGISHLFQQRQLVAPGQQIMQLVKIDRSAEVSERPLDLSAALSGA